MTVSLQTQHLINFPIGTYVEIHSFPNENKMTRLCGIGTVIGIQMNSIEEIVFEVKIARYPHRPVNDVQCFHPSNLRLIGEKL